MIADLTGFKRKQGLSVQVSADVDDKGLGGDLNRRNGEFSTGLDNEAESGSLALQLTRLPHKVSPVGIAPSRP